MDGISVIVCCYNSAARLPETIKHLASQKVPSPIQWEIIIVNNASTDNTKNTATTEWANYNLPSVEFRIVDENMPGLSNARSRGVNEAKFETIVFCDDDNWLSEDYLSIAHNLITENKAIGAVGGQSDFVSNINIVPEWFYDYQENFAVGKQRKTSGNVNKRSFLFGSGLTLRRMNYLTAFKNFPSLLSDRKGKELSCGGDNEICLRLMLMGFDLHYDRDLRFTHFIPKERLTLEYFDKLHLGIDESNLGLARYRVCLTLFSLTKRKKNVLFIKSLIRFILGKTLIRKKWNLEYEGLQLYLNGGLKISKMDKEFLQIKKWIISIR